MKALTENELSHIVIGAAIEVHKELGGPGLLEDIYEEALCYELSLRGIQVERQVGTPVIYKGKELRKRLVLDIVAGEKLIVEIKAVEKYISSFEQSKAWTRSQFRRTPSQGWCPPSC